MSVRFIETIRNSDSRKFVIKNLLIVIILTPILYFSITLNVCPNSWKKFGTYLQIFGVILVSIWVILGGLWRTQFIAQYLQGYWQKTPSYLATFGLPFVLAGLFLQL